MKKGVIIKKLFLSFFQIFILVITIFSFSFFMNLSFVTADHSIFHILNPTPDRNSILDVPEGGSFDNIHPDDFFKRSNLPNPAGSTAGPGALAGGTPYPNEFATKSYKIFDIVDTGLTGNVVPHLAQGLVWAGVVYFGAKTIGSLLGLSDKNSNALGIAGVAGV